MESKQIDEDLEEKEKTLTRRSLADLGLTTNERPDHAQANVRVFVDGLSVVCTNWQQECLEIGFVAEEHTPVDLCIYDVRTGNVVGHFLCPKTQQFRIEVSKTHPRDLGVFYQDSRMYEDDFLWMPDLEEWHAAPVSIRRHAKGYFSAKLVIRDGVYHTGFLSESRALRISSSGRLDRLPALGRILGANITCDEEDSGVRVVVFGRGFTGEETEVFSQSLDKQGGPYVVCVGTSAEKDHDSLEILYDRVVQATGTFSIRYERKELEWICCGLVGNSETGICYPKDSEEAGKIPDKLRVFFATLKHAIDAGYKVFKPRATEYACQSYGGGNGPLPDLP